MVSAVGGPDKEQDACGSGTPDAVATYLQETVAKTLAEGIAATIKAQPEDPPLFLSRWLLQYVEECQKQLQAFSTARNTASVGEREVVTAPQTLPTQLELRGLNTSDTEAVKTFQEVEWVEEDAIAKVLNHLKEKLGATGVYLAKYEEQILSKDEDATGALRYIAADESHTYMLNYCLHEEEGLTWDLLQDDEPGKELETPSKDSKDEDDGDEEGLFSEAEAENHLTSSNAPENEIDNRVTRKSLIVEEVLDNPRIRFFGPTRPGSYIAVSMELAEVANTDSVMALFNWMKEKREREEAIAASQEQDETASSASGESGAAPVYVGGGDGTEGDLDEDDRDQDELNKPLAPPTLRSTREKYVLCADSLGQEISFDTEALRCLQFFAEEIGKTIVRTQKEAVERQAAEMLNAHEKRDLEEQLSELQQNCSMKLQQVQEQRQADALQLLDEQEAEEIADAERRRQEQELRQQEKAAARKTTEEEAMKKEGEEERSDFPTSDSLSNHGESDVDAKSDEEILIPPPLSRQCVLDATSTHVALELFNEEVLTPLKEKFSLSQFSALEEGENSFIVDGSPRDILAVGQVSGLLNALTRYIADSPKLVSTAAACALLLGYELNSANLKTSVPAGHAAPRNYKDKENGLQFITEMLDNEIQTEEEHAQQPLEMLLSSWLSSAVKARQKELVLQKEKLRRAALIQRAPPPEVSQLIELDPDFACVGDNEA
ncbi:uncharacterized protein EMH_0068570 [Eimeria mitis]|uniref:Uncharacterized protein n=1 Tax=Eimeria mitis TaxID=44415 RepID=U6KDZ5_9EIME|nr:uncharacterized protein EMH_0068570 [Eimeria mitis]CDJ36250.1 hypothetical protein, conserved [Eimeria mitis]